MKRDGAGRSGEMEVFATVVSAGSLSAAARAMGLTPSAVSRILARIEARLGVRLLVRTTRAIALTAEGETYLRAARRIVADLDEVDGAIADQGTPRGRLRVSAALAHGRLAIVPLLGLFSARHPGILVDINLSDRLVDILGGEADVAIRFGPLADSPLTARRLGESGRVVVAAPDYLALAGTPREPEDLLAHNCMGFNFRRAEPGWPFRRDAGDFALTVTGTIQANNGETLAQLARQGVGVARVGRFAVEEDIAAGRLIPLLEAYNPQDRETIHVVFVGGASTPARVRVFIDFLAEQFAIIRSEIDRSHRPPTEGARPRRRCRG